MFRRIRFDWQLNQSLPIASRILRVETHGGQRAPLTWAELSDMVGELETRRLFRVAIKRGTGKWHKASAPASMALAA